MLSVSCGNKAWRGEFVNMDRCLTLHSQPKAAKTGKVGHWRAFLTTICEPERMPGVVMRVSSHFPLTTVSRVSPSLSAPAFSCSTRAEHCQPRPATCVSRQHDHYTVTGSGCQCTLDLLANLSVLVVHRMQKPRSTTSRSPALHNKQSPALATCNPQIYGVRHNSSIGAFIPLSLL